MKPSAIPQLSNVWTTALLFAVFSGLLMCSRPVDPPDPPVNNEPDTTSHDIFWQVDTVGSYNSIFRDVAVINDSLIYTCGEIYSEERQQHGLAIWNGLEWKLKYLRLPSMSGGSITPYGIWTFSENNIWFASGTILRLKNNKLERMWDNGHGRGNYKKMWASSEEDIWFVGQNGSIMHYDGNSFTTMEKLTNIELTDVWGTGPDNVWASGYKPEAGTVILHFNGTIWSVFHERSWDDYRQLDTTVISGPAVSIWTDSKDYIWVITYWGLYKVNSNDAQDFIRYPEVAGYHIWVDKLRGFTSKDIFFCGPFTAIWHFNGKTTCYYSGLKGDVKLLNIATKQDKIFIVGTDYNTNRAVILTGRR